MPKFYPEAFVAATHGRLTQAELGALNEWAEVAAQLDALSPKEQCDAIYADWLLQLHQPGGDAQVQVRDLLLGQGALAANYLGELAQNADDAGAGSLLVQLREGWLLVANSGRVLRPLNLLGLCRFFVHSDGEVVGLTADTIGRFGIGFKASHRVAQQLLVFSWEKKERREFGFRLPIAFSRTDESMPDSDVLSGLTNSLAVHGSKNINPLRPTFELGHCTPEYCATPDNGLPCSLAKCAAEFRAEHPEQGTWFALNLHEAGAREAAERIAGQVDTLYELCPLFLKNLSEITIQGRTLRMVKGKEVGRITAGAIAKRVTLEFSGPGSTHNDRFIVLEPRPDTSECQWRIALPADSVFRLKEPVHAEFSLRNGGAYAYLPLPALSWPWPVHLHIPAPTNLARSDWNPAEEYKLREYLTESANALADWVAQNRHIWHPTWHPADFFPTVIDSAPAGSSSRIFSEALQDALAPLPSLRTLWGGVTSPQKAVSLRLESGSVILDAWKAIGDLLPDDVKEQYPLVLAKGGAASLKIEILTTQDAQQLFEAVASLVTDKNLFFWQNFIKVVLGTDSKPSGGYSRSRMIEEALHHVLLTRTSGDPLSLREASTLNFAVSLLPEWHEFFRHLSVNWLGRNWTLSELHVYGISVNHLLSSLMDPTQVPADWAEVLRMTKEEFQQAGDEFWRMSRPRCPLTRADQALEQIWIESGRAWVRLVDTWIGEEPVEMLSGIVEPWKRRPDELNSLRRRKMLDQLRSWDLLNAYEALFIIRIKQRAEIEFNRRLKEESPNRADRLKFLILAANWRPDRLPLAWQKPVREAAAKAITSLLQNEATAVPPGTTLLMGDSVRVHMLSWMSGHLAAPPWLEPIAVTFLENEGVLNQLGVKVLNLNQTTLDEIAFLGENLLREFHRWSSRNLVEDHFSALETLWANVSGNWVIGLPGNRERRVNEFCDWIELTVSEETTVTPRYCVLRGHDSRAFVGCEPLPGMLARVRVLRAKTIPLEQFSRHLLDEEDLLEMASGELPPGLEANPWFTRLRTLLPHAKLVAASGTPELRWTRKRDGMEMQVTVSKSAFGLCEFHGQEAIYISVPTLVPRVSQGTRVSEILYAYKSISPNDSAIAQVLQSGRNLAKFYRENRAKIKERLVQHHATDMGYEGKHVMRELLQNAESAYASRKKNLLPACKTFEVRMADLPQSSGWVVQVTHQGRCFNEQDAQGNSRRDDIARLCALGAMPNHTENEVGRFNRGFKSVFQVTDAVSVTSGEYKFTVEDLLLLTPADPQPDAAQAGRPTTFEFSVAVDKKAELLSERRGHIYAYQPMELVFLRFIDAVSLWLNGELELEFTLRRCDSPSEGWESVVIQSKEGLPYAFLVRRSVLEDGQRLGVAVSVDSSGRPVPVPRESRFLYRTFALEQHSLWSPFLINSDFVTDHGRSGLLPDLCNDNAILTGMKEALALARHSISTGGHDIHVWLAWVRWLEWDNLASGSSLLQAACRPAFHSALTAFETWLWQHLPDGTSLRPWREYGFPSQLLRRLHHSQELPPSLAILPVNWIDEAAARALETFGDFPGRRIRLREHVEERLAAGLDKEECRMALERISHLDFADDPIIRHEIDEALLVVRADLAAIFMDFGRWLPEPEDFQTAPNQSIAIEDIIGCWDVAKAREEFTLAGWMGRLIFPPDLARDDRAQAALLRNVDTNQSKTAWFRLFCMGSLLGARCRPTVIREFWEGQLAPRGILDEKQKKSELARILDDVSHQKFMTLDAAGEAAELWRRVFYDFQKLRIFVFEDSLPAVLGEYIELAEHPDDIIMFLKSGKLADGERWKGVVGQSMTAPLLWIMRELRRIGFIPDTRFDPTCIYTNAPVRRIMRELNWITEAEWRAYDFQSLCTLSAHCHEMLAKHAPELLPFFDLPLQWYSLQNPR